MEGYAAGDSNGDGYFKLFVGGTEIVSIARRDSREGEPVRVKDTWRGRLVLTAAQLAASYVEVSNSSQGSARIRGMVVPERFADPRAVRPLDGPELLHARATFDDLVAATTEEARLTALATLSELGPAVIPYLEALVVEAEAEVRARRLALERFGAGP